MRAALLFGDEDLRVVDTADPVTVPGEVVVRIEAEVTRMEWASNLVFRLGPRDRDAPGAIEVEIGARGGGRVYRRGYRCAGAYPSGGERYDALPSSDAVVKMPRPVRNRRRRPRRSAARPPNRRRLPKTSE